MKMKNYTLLSTFLMVGLTLVLATSCNIQNPPRSGKAHVGIALPPPKSAERTAASKSKSTAANVRAPSFNSATKKSFGSQAGRNVRSTTETRGYSRSMSEQSAASRKGFFHPPLGEGKRTGSGPRMVSPANRALSISNGDIESISYQLYNIDPSYSWDYLSDIVDPEYPYIDVWLIPGQTYHISVNVEIGPDAPGRTVGVSKYGVEQTFTVPYDADGWENPFWVDLYLRPTETNIFFPYMEGGDNQPRDVSYISQANPHAGPSVARVFDSSSISSVNNDKFFYGIEGNLYYLNTYDNESGTRLFIWRDLDDPINETVDLVFSDLDNALIAATADPIYEGWIYALTRDFDNRYFIWEINADTGTGTILCELYDLSNLSAPRFTLSNLVITGLGTYTDLEYNTSFYVSYYGNASIIGTPNTYFATSAVSAFNIYGDRIADSPLSSFDVFVDESTNPDQVAIPMDVTVIDGLVYVLLAPQFYGFFGPVPFGDTAVGKSDIWVLDPFDLGSVYSSSLSQILNGSTGLNGTLKGPLKFLGFDTSGNIYFNQKYMVLQGADIEIWLSSVNRFLDSVTDYTISVLLTGG